MNTTEPLVDGPAARLAWNVEPDQFWFHYTTQAAAQAIFRTGFYLVGTRAKRAGMFVTTIQPGAASSTELLNRLFDGTRDPERTSAAVVLRRDAIDLPVERESEFAWRFATPPSSTVDLRDGVVGWAAKNRRTWHFTPELLA